MSNGVGGGGFKPVTVSETRHFFSSIDVIPYQDSGDDQGFVVKTLNDLKRIETRVLEHIIFIILSHCIFLELK